MPTEENQKILYLESLRGIAAMSVALFHAMHYNSFINDIGFIQNSGLMVDFFFVLSGFVIAFSYSNKLNSYKELFIFQIKRFLRLYPLHFLTLLIFLFIEIFKNYYFAEVSLNQHVVNDASAFINNIFLTHSFFVNDLTFNGQSWSISTEFYTYLIFGFLLVAFKNYKFLQASFFIIIFLISAYGVYSIHIDTFISPENITNGIGGISRCIYSFFIGSFIFFIYQHKRFSITSIWQYIILLITVAFVSGNYSYQFLLAPLFFSLLIFVFLNSENSFLKVILSNNFLIYLGTISYGIYMIHGFVWWCINRILVNIYDYNYYCEEESATCIIETNYIIGNMSLIFGLLIIYCLSVLSHKYVEMPINSFRNKFKI